MTNLHESYLAGHGFDITTPRVKTDLSICHAANCAIGPGEYACMYIYMCACSNVCVSERAFVYAGDGWTDEQRMERWVDLNVFMCVCARPCLRACDPMCKDGMIAAILDG